MHEYDSTFEYIKHNKKSATLIFFFLIIITLSISLYIKCNEEPVIKYKTKKVVEECKEEAKEKLIVDIKGYVKKPGVYEVEEGTRISDVIELAGGLLLSANTRYLNLSKKVTDELVIIVYSDTEIKEMIEKGEIEEKLPEVKDENLITEGKTEENNKNENTNEINGKININTASLEELMTLTGIGETKAEAIIEYRNKNKFKTIEDLMEVSGIGESTFEKIKDDITV